MLESKKTYKEGDLVKICTKTCTYWKCSVTVNSIQVRLLLMSTPHLSLLL